MKKIYFNKVTKEYTFSEKTDGELNVNVIPPKFSVEDKFGKYRRIAIKEQKERELSGQNRR